MKKIGKYKLYGNINKNVFNITSTVNMILYKYYLLWNLLHIKNKFKLTTKNIKQNS